MTEPYETPLLVRVWSSDLLRLLSRVSWTGNLLSNGEAPPQPTRWKRLTSRLRGWWRTHRPVLHWGECDHDDCYWPDESPKWEDDD